MKTKTGFARKPDPRAVSSFIESAGVPARVEAKTPRQPPAALVAKSTDGRPWENARGDVSKQYMLRLPETYIEMLRFISDNVPKTSMQSFCLDVLKPAIKKKVEEITGTNVKEANHGHGTRG